MAVQKSQMIYLIQQRQLKKLSQTTWRRYIGSKLYRHIGKNETVERQKVTDITSTKQETHTKSESNTNLILGDLSILYKRMIVNLKREVQFLKEQLVLKDNYFREEVVFLCNKLDIALSNQVNNSHTHIVSQYSSNIEYKEDDNNQSDFHQ